MTILRCVTNKYHLSGPKVDRKSGGSGWEAAVSRGSCTQVAHLIWFLDDKHQITYQMYLDML